MQYRIKRNVLVSAGMALVAVLLVIIAGGCEDADAVSRVSTLGMPSVKGLTFSGASVQNAREAQELFETLVGTSSSGEWKVIKEAIEDADGKAFHEKFGKQYTYSIQTWVNRDEQMNKSKVNYNVSIRDEEKLKAAINTGTSSSAVKAAVITGGTTGTANLKNRVLREVWLPYGDNTGYTVSLTSNRTFEISDGYAEWPSSEAGKQYQLAGVIRTSYRSTKSHTQKSALDKRYNESDSSESKLAAAIAFSDGTKGAIFRFSYAVRSGSSESRSIKGATTMEYTIVEVYDERGSRLKDCDIDTDNFPSLDSFTYSPFRSPF